MQPSISFSWCIIHLSAMAYLVLVLFGACISKTCRAGLATILMIRRLQVWISPHNWKQRLRILGPNKHSKNRLNKKLEILKNRWSNSQLKKLPGKVVPQLHASNRCHCCSRSLRNLQSCGRIRTEVLGQPRPHAFHDDGGAHDGDGVRGHNYHDLRNHHNCRSPRSHWSCRSHRSRRNHHSRWTRRNRRNRHSSPNWRRGGVQILRTAWQQPRWKKKNRICRYCQW